MIATETPLHFAMAKAALQAGKHVFVEKPLAQTVEQAERLVALADEGGRTLMGREDELDANKQQQQATTSNK